MNQKLFFPHGRDSFFLHCGAFCCKMRLYVHGEDRHEGNYERTQCCRSAFAGASKTEGASRKRPFRLRKRQAGGRSGHAAARSGALYRKGARGGIRADDRAGGKRGLRAVRRFNGGDAGGQHGENAAGRRLHGADSPAAEGACGAAARRARRGAGSRQRRYDFAHGGCGGV